MTNTYICIAMPTESRKYTCETCGGAHPTEEHSKVSLGVENTETEWSDSPIQERLTTFLEEDSSDPAACIRELRDLGMTRADYEEMGQRLEQSALENISLLGTHQIRIRGECPESPKAESSNDEIAKMYEGEILSCVRNAPVDVSTEQNQLALLCSLLIEIRHRARYTASKESEIDTRGRQPGTYTNPGILYGFSSTFSPNPSSWEHRAPAKIITEGSIFKGQGDDIGEELENVHFVPTPRASEKSPKIKDVSEALFPIRKLSTDDESAPFVRTEHDYDRTRRLGNAMGKFMSSNIGYVMEMEYIDTYCNLLMFANTILADLKKFADEQRELGGK